MEIGIGRWLRALVAALALAFSASRAAPAAAAPVAVRYAEAPSHAFLVLSDLAGKTLAGGELVQWQERGALANRLVFRFDDGSLYDETVRFTAGRVFRLLSYRLVQKGHAFTETSEVEFDRGRRRYTASKRDASGEVKPSAGVLDVPDDAYNGMTSTLLKNLGAGASADVHVLAFTPSPQVVDVRLTREGTDPFWIGDTEMSATRFLVTPKVGGAKGVLATLVGKQPEPVRFWLTAGRVPTFVRFEGPLYTGGPPWRVELAAARWKRERSGP